MAKKGEFAPGDLCVYFEIDSFLPIRPEFEFLRSGSYKNSPLLGEGFHLKTQVFRGQISQGLCLPVNTFKELSYNLFDGVTDAVPDVGTDVTELLGVRKWEMPELATGSGTAKGELPSFIHVTDDVRVQADPSLLEQFRGLEYYITTKIDGTSQSCAIDSNGEFHVTGHHYEYKDDGKNGLFEMLKSKGIEPPQSPLPMITAW